MGKAVAVMAARAILIGSFALAAAACAPEVGSKRWCTAMRDKPRGDWTGNEALDFARHCVLAGDDEKK